MKLQTNFWIGVALCYFACLAPDLSRAQEVGFLRFVNAVGLEGDLTIEMDGEKVNATGYASGEYTGGVGLSEGAYKFEFSHPNAEKLKLRITVVASTTACQVIYAKPKFDKDGKVVGQELASKEVEPVAPGGASATVVSLLSRKEPLELELAVEGSKKPVAFSLESGKQKKITLRSGGDFLLAKNKKVIKAMTIAEAANYALVVFEAGSGGKLRVTSFVNETFERGN